MQLFRRQPFDDTSQKLHRRIEKEHGFFNTVSMTESTIGHFRITVSLFFKASPGAHPFIWKLVFIHMQMKTNFHMKRWAPGLALKKRPEIIRKWPFFLTAVPENLRLYERVVCTFMWYVFNFRQSLLCNVLHPTRTFAGCAGKISKEEKEKKETPFALLH